MSSTSDTYKLQILFDDTKVKKLLDAINKFNGATGSTGSSSGGLFGNSGSMFKNLTKLGAIATGVAGIAVTLNKIATSVVEASPILQTMLKLFNTSIMFIFRPIGDFIGFFLRPIMIYFLRNIALPMYRQWGPVMRSLGTWLGNNTVEAFGANLLSNFTFTPLPNDPLFGVNGFFTKELPDAITRWSAIWNISMGRFSQSVKQLGPLFDRTISFLKPIFGSFIQGAKSVFSGLGQFFNGVWSTISETLKPAWDAITGFIESIVKFFRWLWDSTVGAFSELIGSAFPGAGSTQGLSDARSRRGGDTNVVIENINVTDNGTGSTAGVQVAEDISREVGKRVRGFR